MDRGPSIDDGTGEGGGGGDALTTISAGRGCGAGGGGGGLTTAMMGADALGTVLEDSSACDDAAKGDG